VLSYVSLLAKLQLTVVLTKNHHETETQLVLTWFMGYRREGFLWYWGHGQVNLAGGHVI